MLAAAFSHVDAWVFDLDNTLYPPSDRLFDQIEARMRDFIVRTVGVSPDRADMLRDDYWREHGTTLAGLMAHHGTDPEQFMVNVHDIDMSHMQVDAPLRAGIAALRGRKIVYTNGSRPYALRVLAARGLADLFDDVYGVEHANYVPKPAQSAFETVLKLAGITAHRAAMFEDDLRNLAAPHLMGMRTVHVAPAPDPRPFVHYHTDDLPGFLSQVR